MGDFPRKRTTRQLGNGRPKRPARRGQLRHARMRGMAALVQGQAGRKGRTETSVGPSALHAVYSARKSQRANNPGTARSCEKVRAFTKAGEASK